MNLDTFISNVKSGLARTNHFFVELSLPPKLVVTDPTKSNLNKVLLFCDQAQLPGLSYGTNQVRTYGEFREVPYEKLYEPITLSFYVDKNMYVKNLFEEWINLIQDRKTRDFEFPVNYLKDIDIYVLDTDDDKKYKVTLKNAYPKAVGAVQLDYAAKDIMKLQVTISYKYYETELYGAKGDANRNGALDSARALFEQDLDTFAIPSNYFNDFTGFQNQFSDFSFDGVKSFDSIENIGERFGFGNIFK